jgi:hypothetical protein
MTPLGIKTPTQPEQNPGQTDSGSHDSDDTFSRKMLIKTIINFKT